MAKNMGSGQKCLSAIFGGLKPIIDKKIQEFIIFIFIQKLETEMTSAHPMWDGKFPKYPQGIPIKFSLPLSLYIFLFIYLSNSFSLKNK